MRQRTIVKKIPYHLLASTLLLVLSIPFFGQIPAHAESREPQCHILVIGVSEYPIRDHNVIVINEEGENVIDIDLKYSNNDAHDIYDDYSSVWGPGGATLLLNKDATKADIYYTIQRLVEDTSAEDRVLIYFSGHGKTPDEAGSLPGRLYAQRSGAGFISPYGTRISHLDYEISAVELASWLKDLKSNNVVIMLDTCYAGSFNHELSGNGRVVLMSSAADEPSLECSEIGHGLFTNFILQAVNDFDNADTNHDNVLSAEEIFDYAGPLTIDGICTCNEEPLKDSIKQHPVLSDGYPGELGLFMKVTVDIQIPSLSQTVTYTVDENTYSSGAPSSFLWTPGSTHSLEIPSTLESDTGERFTFVSWNDGNTSVKRTITDGGIYTATYKKQYKVNLYSSYGSLSGEGWYDEGATATLAAAPKNELLIRRKFSGWSGDINENNSVTAIYVDSEKNIEARWYTDYSLLYMSAMCMLFILCAGVVLYIYMKKKHRHAESG